MGETNKYERRAKKWAIILYGLTAVYGLVIAASAIFASLTATRFVGVLFILLLVLIAVRKKSRAADILIIIEALWSSFDVFMELPNLSAAGAGEFGAGVLYLVIMLPIAFAAVMHLVATIRYHRSVGNRLVWRNAVINSVICLTYAVALVLLLVAVMILVSIELPEEELGIIGTVGIAAILALAAFRKLPGTRKRPITAPVGDEDAVLLASPGSFAEDMSRISLSSLMQGTEDGGHIVSPTGVFGRSYRLTHDQFISYLEQHQARVRKQAWIWYLVIPAGLLGVFAEPLGFSGLFLSALPVIGLALVAILVIALWRQKRKFRRDFPDAPVARPDTGRFDTFLFAYGAGITGKPWLIIPSVVLALLFALIAIGLTTEEPVPMKALSFVAGISLFLLISPIAAIAAKRRFRRRHGHPLTAENLLAVKSGEVQRVFS